MWRAARRTQTMWHSPSLGLLDRTCPNPLIRPTNPSTPTYSRPIPPRTQTMWQLAVTRHFVTGSFELDACCLDYLRPFIDLGPEENAELLGAAAPRFSALGLEP